MRKIRFEGQRARFLPINFDQPESICAMASFRMRAQTTSERST
jgi:hypothetical protein